MLDSSTTVALLAIFTTVSLALIAGILRMLDRRETRRKDERVWFLELSQVYDQAPESSATRQYAKQELEASGILVTPAEALSEGAIKQELEAARSLLENASKRARRLEFIVRWLALIGAVSAISSAAAGILSMVKL